MENVILFFYCLFAVRGGQFLRDPVNSNVSKRTDRMDFTYSLDLHFHASHIDANHIGASTYENHIRAFRRPEGQTIPISDALSFILHRVTDSNILKSRGQAIMQAQKDAFQHFNIAFLGCLQFQSYEKKPYPKAIMIRLTINALVFIQ